VTRLVLYLLKTDGKGGNWSLSGSFLISSRRGRGVQSGSLKLEEICESSEFYSIIPFPSQAHLNSKSGIKTKLDGFEEESNSEHTRFYKGENPLCMGI